jgi:transketolase
MVHEKIKDINKLKLIANEIRQDLVRSLVSAGSGHSAGTLDMADVFTALYFNVMRHHPKNPWWPDRDRFVLSNGHICPLFYVTLARAGYFQREEVLTLRKLGTRLQGHPHRRSLPGVENSAGPLGQGISIAAGMAYAAKMDKKKHYVYCSLGDGELNEGQVWEAFMFAAKNKLDNLIAFVDRNFIQIDGNTEDVMPLYPLGKKFKAFGWKVIETDGNDMQKVVRAFRMANIMRGKPIAIIFHTVPGKGVHFIEGKYQWHGKPPSKDQGEIALAELCERHYSLEGKKCVRCEADLVHCNCIEGE